jgi:hypothetical protein
MAKAKQGSFTLDIQKPTKRGFVAKIVIYTHGASGEQLRWERDIRRDKAIEYAVKLMQKCR